ncbi:cytosol aminopeptidase PepA [Cutibacterium acnes JCM 18918]|nr:cytosol aminopeptidase PepA [Cutibacterium acnes JCM 18918]
MGKGITFDSGGLNIKTAANMYTMKCDMGGAAAVLAAIGAIARLGLNVRVVAYGCLAENMPSGSGWRPSDVVTMYDGTTVENGNSDAEGRIVMADGLARACEDNPDFIVDISTLTGACMVALGNHTAGVMTSGAQAADTLLDASELPARTSGSFRLPTRFAKACILTLPTSSPPALAKAARCSLQLFCNVS